MKAKVAKRRRTTRTAGRPSVQSSEDVRAALLTAGERLFLRHGFAKVTSRQLAAAAETTPAMINYYFGDKQGLFSAILTNAIAPFADQLTSALAATTDDGIDPAVMIRAHMRTAASNAWIGTLLVNEVFAEGGQLRTTFQRDFAGRFAPLITQLLARAKQAGRLRADVDPQLATLSFLSLCAFPIISRAITGPVLGIRLQGEDLERLIDHTVRMFLEGCGT